MIRLVALSLLFFLSFNAYAESAFLLSASIPQKSTPRTAFFVYWTSPDAPQTAPAAYRTSGEQLTAVALVRTGSESSAPTACMVVAYEKESVSYCSESRVLEYTTETEAKMRSEVQMSKDANRARRQEVLDKEIKLREVRETIGNLVRVDELVAIRNKRLETETQNASFAQELETLERSVEELRKVKPTDVSQLIERSLQGSLFELQKITTGKRGK